MTTSTLVRELRPFEVMDDIDRRGLLRIGASAGAGMALGVPVLAGCNVGSEATPSPDVKPPTKPTGVLRVANPGEPSSLDVTRTSGGTEHAILWHNLYESLVGFKGHTSDLVGVLAQSFESSPDAREWTFRLKSGIKFHDGEPFTSSAVKASFDYYRTSPSYLALLVPKDAKLDDSDQMVLRITASSPLPDLARFLTSLFIISPKLIKAGEDAIAKNPTGTGPFTFVSYKTAESVVLAANPDYRGPGPYVEQVVYPIIPDADARVAALRSGSIDLVTDIPPANASPLRGDNSIRLTEAPVWQKAKLFMFTKTPPMDNVNVRQALAHAIDRMALVKTILAGAGTVEDSWVPAGVYGHQEPKSEYPYDPERAKKLLAESGLPTPVGISFVTIPGSSPYDQLTQAIAAMADEVGFATTMKPVAAAEWSKVVFRPPDVKPWHAIVSYWGNPTGSVGFFSDLNLMKRFLQFDDSAFTKLASKAAMTPDGPERVKLYAEMEERHAELVPAINLYTRKQIDGRRAGLHGYTPTNFGTDPSFSSVFLAT